ncbi:MAG: response regulator FixJ [Caulobacteraceae bacterium]|jgi:two-component system response regulator FixJ
MARSVYVIDDDDAVRDSLSFLLETAGFTVNAFESGASFLKSFTGRESGCVVTDVRMPGLSGLELAARLRDLGARLPIIVMTGHGDVPMAVEAMKAGVHDFIEKPFDDEVMISSIEQALMRAELTETNDSGRAEAQQRIAALSKREHQVLAGLVEGKANKVIARDLGISPRTVEIYRANVMTKMGAANLSELVRMAIAAGS